MRLHAAATAITVEHGGVVPDSVEELLPLPGIGEYTARAVAAFAFGARTPVVDTNVRRVLSRVVRGVDEPREPATAADRAEMAALLPAEPARAARFSAAVMELGALVCTARSPACGSCPLADRCRWRLAGCRRRCRPGARCRPGTAPTGRCAAGSWRRCGTAARRCPRSPSPHADVDAEQVARCLASLLADGLAVRVGRRTSACRTDRLRPLAGIEPAQPRMIDVPDIRSSQRPDARRR